MDDLGDDIYCTFITLWEEKQLLYTCISFFPKHVILYNLPRADTGGILLLRLIEVS